MGRWGLSASATVVGFREILLWPLVLEGDGDVVARAAAALNASTQTWTPCRTAWDWLTGADAAAQYAALVYFHPVVRRLIDPPASRAGAAPALRGFRRTDVRRLGVTVFDESTRKQTAIELEAERVLLFLAEPGIALLAVEVATPALAAFKVGVRGAIPLSLVQSLHDQVRRAFPPYWHAHGAGHSPVRAQWLDGSGKPLSPEADYASEATHVHALKNLNRDPIASHWAWILEPLESVSHGARGCGFRQLGDDRIPGMSYVAVDDPRRLTRGDFARLAHYDEAGPQETLPYATEFLASFEGTHCYDRFWDPGRRSHAWMTTRYLCTGQSFVAVGSEWAPRGERPNSFFTDAQTGGLGYFRSHYFIVGLLVHLHRATMLAFADRIADALTQLAPAAAAQHGVRSERAKAQASRRRVRRDACKLLQDVLKFSHRFALHEITNQMQGQELFQLWRGQLGIDGLQERLSRDVAAIESAIASEQAMEIEVRNDHLARAADVVSAVAAVGVAATVLIPLLQSSWRPELERVVSTLWTQGPGGLPRTVVLSAGIGLLAAVALTTLVVLVTSLTVRWALRRFAALESRREGMGE